LHRLNDAKQDIHHKFTLVDIRFCQEENMKRGLLIVIPYSALATGYRHLVSKVTK